LRIFFNGNIELDEENWNKLCSEIQSFFKDEKIGEFYFEVEK
jgi:hypothetical protein|tara:strand:- start:1739 stop:1864 length:126 start_codon:yes stop_codon:yes gene_type:complete